MANDDDLIEDLLLRYEETLAAGEQLTIEVLCKDHPHLAPQLRREIGLLKQVDQDVAKHPILTPQPVPRPASPSLPVGRYSPGSIIGEGAFGEVRLANDTELKRQVALKRLKASGATAEEKQKFLVEALITSRLDHPGVVPVHGLVYDEHQNPAYAMRRIRGDRLSLEISRYHRAHPVGSASPNAPTDLQTLLRSFLTVCQTVAFAHHEGFLHRDLKPENVMVGRFGETIVVDWGLAKRIAEKDRPVDLEGTSGAAPEHDDALNVEMESVSKSVDGDRRGSAPYMSPEAAAGRVNEIGPASDIYSLGAILYNLLTGQLAFNDRKRIFAQIEVGDFPRPREVRSDIPFGLEAICLKAMALKPEDRYASAHDLARDVERWLADEPVLAAPEPWEMRMGRWLKRNQTAVVTSIAVLIMAAIGLGGYGAVQAEHNARLKESNEALQIAQNDLKKKNEDLERTERDLRQKNSELTASRDQEERSYLAAKRSLLGIARKVLGSELMLSEELTPVQLSLFDGLSSAYGELGRIRQNDKGLRQEAALVRLFAVQRPLLAGISTKLVEEIRPLRSEIESLYAATPKDATNRFLVAGLEITEAMLQLRLFEKSTAKERAAARSALQKAREHLESIIDSKESLSFDPLLSNIYGQPDLIILSVPIFEFRLANIENDLPARERALTAMDRDLRRIEVWISSRRGDVKLAMFTYGSLIITSAYANFELKRWDRVAELSEAGITRMRSGLTSETTPVNLASTVAALEYVLGKALYQQDKLEPALKAFNSAADRLRKLIARESDSEWHRSQGLQLRTRLINTLRFVAVLSVDKIPEDRKSADAAIKEAYETVSAAQKRFTDAESKDILNDVLMNMDSLSKELKKE